MRRELGDLGGCAAAHASTDKGGKTMGKTAAALAAMMLALGARAVEWRGIDESSHIAGAKITSPDKLANRVVLVDMWGHRCPPCRALLPRMQEMWENFGLPANKPFVLIGSHRQDRNEESIKALVEKNKITYPVYQGAGLAADEPDSGGGLPFIYVLNHRGKVVYKGRSDRDALEAVVNALDEVGKVPSLKEGVKFVKFKQLEDKLELGKPIQPYLSKLEAAAKGKDAESAKEARAILDAIGLGLARTKEEIDFQIGNDPKEALKYIKLMKATWPKEAEEAYKAEVPALLRAVKEKADSSPKKPAK